MRKKFSSAAVDSLWNFSYILVRISSQEKKLIWRKMDDEKSQDFIIKKKSWKKSFKLWIHYFLPFPFLSSIYHIFYHHDKKGIISDLNAILNRQVSILFVRWLSLIFISFLSPFDEILFSSSSHNDFFSLWLLYLSLWNILLHFFQLLSIQFYFNTILLIIK